MFQWVKKLYNAKVQITIIYPPPSGVVHTTIPKVKGESNVNVIKRSNLRFVQHDVISELGDTQTYYCTEVYEGRFWSMARNTWFADKSQAIDAHIKLAKNGVVGPHTVDTVLWEGLSNEEVITWAEMQR